MAAPFTVFDAMIACGVPNVGLFNGQTQATRIASEIFDNSFQAAMEKTIDDLKDDFEPLRSLPQHKVRFVSPQGQSKI